MGAGEKHTMKSRKGRPETDWAPKGRLGKLWDTVCGQVSSWVLVLTVPANVTLADGCLGNQNIREEKVCSAFVECLNVSFASLLSQALSLTRREDDCAQPFRVLYTTSYPPCVQQAMLSGLDYIFILFHVGRCNRPIANDIAIFLSSRVRRLIGRAFIQFQCKQPLHSRRSWLTYCSRKPE